MRYAVLLPPHALARVHSVLSEHGTIDVLMDDKALLVELVSARDDYLVLDPALITPESAEIVARSVAESPRAIVAYSSVSTAALESAVILARYTAARFVFRGTPNERSALEKALFLTTDSNLGAELVLLLQPSLARLPSALRQRLTAMLRNGDGPATPDALAAASAVSRRSLDRKFADAGFAPTRRVIDGVRITAAFRAITTSNMPLAHVTTMLGFRSPRTLDAQLILFFGVTGTRLRAEPPSCTDAARRLALRLTARSASARSSDGRVPRPVSDGPRKLKLVGDDDDTRHSRRNASGDK